MCQPEIGTPDHRSLRLTGGKVSEEQAKKVWDVGAIHLGCVDFRSADQSHFFQLTFQLLLNLRVDSFLAVSNSFCISSTDVG